MAGYVSVISFLALAAGSGTLSASLNGVVRADVVALVLLVIGTAVEMRPSR